MAKITLEDIASGYGLQTLINDNNALLEAAIENTLSRDGTGPNQMEAQLDMNSQRIVNLPTAVNNSEPVTLGQANTLAGVENPLTQNSVGAVLYPSTSAETTAGVTIVNSYYPPGNVLRYGTNTTPGTTDMTAAFNALMSVLAIDTPNSVVIPPGTYLISSTIDCDFNPTTTVNAWGARFIGSHNGVLFDVNPDATAAIPITVSDDTYTKRRIRWNGGMFENTNGTKTASVAMQAYFMRGFWFEPEYITGFHTGVRFGGKDSYHFANGFSFDNTNHFWVPAEGVLYTATLTGNDLIAVSLENWHCSCVGDDYGFFSDNRIIGFSVIGGSFNGAANNAHIRLSDNPTLFSEGVKISGTHFEQMDASTPAILFDASGGTGFYGVEIGGGTQITGATVGWYGVTLDFCRGVKFGSMVFRDGSGGATEQCIYVDSDSRDIEISDATQFLSVAAGQAVVLQAAADRANVTVHPCFIRSATPDILTGYGGDAQSDATATSIDMSSVWADWSSFILPPKGYEVVVTARDSGSAAAGTDACEVRVYKPSSNTASGVTVWLDGENNNSRRTVAGFVGADNNGDMSLDVDATGTDTLDLWIGITGVHQ